MKLLFKSNLFLLALTAFVFIGCGSSTVQDDEIQPSHLSKSSYEQSLPINYYDFAANVLIEGAVNDDYLKLTVNAEDVNVSDFSHMQIYIDTDFDASTGLCMGVEPYRIVGADFMIEDNKLFASVSSSEWKWEFVSDINNSFCVGDKGKGEYKQKVFIERTLIPNLNTDTNEIRVSLEPIDWDWSDTNNYLPSKIIKLEDL